MAEVIIKSPDPDPVSIPTLAEVLDASGIVPAPDGIKTVGVGNSQDGIVTIKDGIVTEVTQAT